MTQDDQLLSLYTNTPPIVHTVTLRVSLIVSLRIPSGPLLSARPWEPHRGREDQAQGSPPTSVLILCSHAVDLSRFLYKTTTFVNHLYPNRPIPPWPAGKRRTRTRIYGPEAHLPGARNAW